ncbi:hypothetical protein [Actinomycetospora sp.]|uniref:hypothetical protein n=1 Tax=Actinomycetospora sp. TaxID=1872135 RepID=UPI002F406248
MAGVTEFVVGDDPIAAVGVVVALGLIAGLAAADVQAWWLLPLAVLVLLVITLARAVRNGSRASSRPPFEHGGS